MNECMRCPYNFLDNTNEWWTHVSRHLVTYKHYQKTLGSESSDHPQSANHEEQLVASVARVPWTWPRAMRRSVLSFVLGWWTRGWRSNKPRFLAAPSFTYVCGTMWVWGQGQIPWANRAWDKNKQGRDLKQARVGDIGCSVTQGLDCLK